MTQGPTSKRNLPDPKGGALRPPRRRTRAWLPALGAAMVLGALAIPALAQAQARTVVILPIDARGGEAARRASASRVAAIGEVIPRTRLRGALRDTGLPVTDSGFADLARRLDAQVIVMARVDETATRIEVRGSDGVVLATRAAPLLRGTNGRQEVADATFSAVSAAVRTLDMRDDAVRERARHSEALEVQERAIEEATRPEPPPPAPPPPRDARPLVEVHSGVEGRMRRLEVNLASRERAVHDSGIFAEAAFDVRVHPLRRAEHGLLRGLYAELGGTYSLTGAATERSQSGTVSMTALRVHGGVGAELDLGRVRLGLGVGGGLDEVSLGTNDVVPSASFGYVRVAPTLRYQLSDDGAVAFDATLGARLAVGVGTLAETYGDSASAWGLDGSMGLSARFGVFEMGARLTGSRWSLDFAPADPGNRESAQNGQDLSLTLGAHVGLAIP
ncbi:MAG: hypothetical protein IT379_01365 [Deltaproteobacteria bacterium]|nr:hypothetical protein [Deltaproteobacteria bacterium]